MASPFHREEDYRAPVQTALSRVILYAHAERELVICLYLFGLDIALKSFTSWRLMAPTLLLVGVGHWGLTKLAAYDPQWRAVFLRHLRYKARYRAGVHPSVSRQKAKPSLPAMRELQ